MRHSFSIEIPWIGYQFDDFIQARHEASIRTWESACETLSSYTYTIEEGIVRIKTDLEPIHKAYKLYPQKQEKKILIKLWVDVPECEAKGPEASSNLAFHHAEQFLYDLFLILNLSSPACFDLYNARFVEFEHWYRNKPTLSSSWLEFVWVESLQQGWPEINHIALNKVLSWYKNLELGNRQIAKTGVEKALFALLHVCRRDGFSPDSLMWLAHALESLYDTPAEAVSKHLRKRIFCVLNLPSDKQKAINKKINYFYDQPSAFVHGALQIAHPLENDILDSSIDDYQSQLIPAFRVAMSLTLATLQKLINEGWRIIIFKEMYSGEPVKPTKTKEL